MLRFTSITLKLFYIFVGTLCSFSNGYSTGAPDSSCYDPVPNHSLSRIPGFPGLKIRPQDQRLNPCPYYLKVSQATYSYGTALSVSILPVEGEDAVKGFMLYAEPTDPQVRKYRHHIGRFIVKGPDVRTMVCNGVDGGVVTHTHNREKFNVTVPWIADLDQYKGAVRFVATIVEHKDTFWTDQVTFSLKRVERPGPPRGSFLPFPLLPSAAVATPNNAVEYLTGTPPVQPIPAAGVPGVSSIQSAAPQSNVIQYHTGIPPVQPAPPAAVLPAAAPVVSSIQSLAVPPQSNAVPRHIESSPPVQLASPAAVPPKAAPVVSSIQSLAAVPPQNNAVPRHTESSPIQPDAAVAAAAVSSALLREASPQISAMNSEAPRSPVRADTVAKAPFVLANSAPSQMSEIQQNARGPLVEPVLAPVLKTITAGFRNGNSAMVNKLTPDVSSGIQVQSNPTNVLLNNPGSNAEVKQPVFPGAVGPQTPLTQDNVAAIAGAQPSNGLTFVAAEPSQQSQFASRPIQAASQLGEILTGQQQHSTAKTAQRTGESPVSGILRQQTQSSGGLKFVAAEPTHQTGPPPLQANFVLHSTNALASGQRNAQPNTQINSGTLISEQIQPASQLGQTASNQLHFVRSEQSLPSNIGELGQTVATSGAELPARIAATVAEQRLPSASGVQRQRQPILESAMVKTALSSAQGPSQTVTGSQFPSEHTPLLQGSGPSAPSNQLSSRMLSHAQNEQSVNPNPQLLSSVRSGVFSHQEGGSVLPISHSSNVAASSVPAPRTQSSRGMEIVNSQLSQQVQSSTAIENPVSKVKQALNFVVADGSPAENTPGSSALEPTALLLNSMKTASIASRTNGEGGALLAETNPSRGSDPALITGTHLGRQLGAMLPGPSAQIDVTRAVTRAVDGLQGSMTHGSSSNTEAAEPGKLSTVAAIASRILSPSANTQANQAQGETSVNLPLSSASQISQSVSQPQRSQSESQPQRSQAELQPQRSQSESQPQRSQAELQPQRSQAELQPQRSQAESQPGRSMFVIAPPEENLSSSRLNLERLPFGMSEQSLSSDSMASSSLVPSQDALRSVQSSSGLALLSSQMSRRPESSSPFRQSAPRSSFRQASSPFQTTRNTELSESFGRLSSPRSLQQEELLQPFRQRELSSRLQSPTRSLTQNRLLRFRQRNDPLTEFPSRTRTLRESILNRMQAQRRLLRSQFNFRNRWSRFGPTRF